MLSPCVVACYTRYKQERWVPADPKKELGRQPRPLNPCQHPSIL